MSLQELYRAIIGPVTGAIVGTLVIGGFITWINHRTLSRRADYDLRSELILQMTDAAGGFVFLARYYELLKETTKDGAESSTYLRVVQDRLGEQYRKGRVAGKALEIRLQAYFPSVALHRNWHAIMDMASVSYFTLIDSPSDRLAVIHEQAAFKGSGEYHSGFTSAELKSKSPDDLLDKVWLDVALLARSVLSTKIIRVSSRHVRA